MFSTSTQEEEMWYRTLAVKGNSLSRIVTNSAQ